MKSLQSPRMETSETYLCGKERFLQLNETFLDSFFFLQCTRPFGYTQWCKHGLTLTHVEKMDFIAKTCNHNMYTDMLGFLYLFIYFFVIFRNIQVDISHIFFILVYSAILCPYALYSQIVKIINKTYRFVYSYNTMYSKKKLSSRLYIYL